MSTASALFVDFDKRIGEPSQSGVERIKVTGLSYNDSKLNEAHVSFVYLKDGKEHAVSCVVILTGIRQEEFADLVYLQWHDIRSDGYLSLELF